MKRILAILDKDRDYAFELAAYAGEKGLTPFSVIAFSDPESLKDFTLRQPVDLLLIGSDIPDETIKDIRTGQVVRLSEDSRRGSLQDGRSIKKEQIPTVSKYQAADRLFAEVMECCRGREGIFTGEGLKSEIIGVCSPVGRCGKTGFAVTLGRILAESSKVMYLNMEECSGLSALTGTVYRRSLTDLIYAMRQGTLDEGMVGSAVYQLGRLDYIAPVSCAEDLAEIRPPELARLAECLAMEEHYQILILDTGDLGRDAFPLLERCGVIYAPMTDDAVSRAKMAEWQDQLLAYGGEDLTGRVRILHLPQPACPTTAEGFFDSLLYGEVGDLVRELLREDGHRTGKGGDDT